MGEELAFQIIELAFLRSLGLLVTRLVVLRLEEGISIRGQLWAAGLFLSMLDRWLGMVHHLFILLLDPIVRHNCTFIVHFLLWFSENVRSWAMAGNWGQHVALRLTFCLVNFWWHWVRNDLWQSGHRWFFLPSYNLWMGAVTLLANKFESVTLLLSIHWLCCHLLSCRYGRFFLVSRDRIVVFLLLLARGHFRLLVSAGLLAGELVNCTDVRELVKREFILESNKFWIWLLVGLQQLEQHLGERRNIALGIACNFGQIMVPRVRMLHDLLSEVQSTHRQVGWLDMDAGLVKHRNFNHVLCQMVGHLVDLWYLGEPSKESVAWNKINIEVELGQDVHFHGHNLLLGVSVVAHYNIVSYHRRPDVFVFASDQHGTYSDELQVFLCHHTFFQEPINQVDC